MDCRLPDSSVHGVSQARILGCHFLLQGIFPTQESNLHLLHWKTGSLPLSHLGSPWKDILKRSLGFVPEEGQSRGSLSSLTWRSVCLVSVWFSLTSSCWRLFLVVALSPPALLTSPLLAILDASSQLTLQGQTALLAPSIIPFSPPSPGFFFLKLPSRNHWWVVEIKCLLLCRVSVEVIRCVLGISARGAWQLSPLSTAPLFSVSTSLLLFPRWVHLCPLLDSTFKW